MVHGRVILPGPDREATVPLPIIRGYFWQLKGLEGDRQPSRPLPFLFFLLTPHLAAACPRAEVEEEGRGPRGPLPCGTQAQETWRQAGG